MGITDSIKGIFGKKEEKKKSSIQKPPTARFEEPCALCGKTGTEKKWMGQYWHKKCMRMARKSAKGMI